VKLDAMTKSSLHQVDILNQLQTMKCPLSTDAKTHLLEVKKHFKKMTEHRKYLRVTNTSVTDFTYVSIIILSMPDIYHPTIQTIETTMKVTRKIINLNNLIDIFIQEAKHHVIGNT
jgi:hypothetical protein